jgi:hypothetical protein
VRSSPTIGSDGTVYVGSGDKKLYAINGKTGVKLWEFETGDGLYGVRSSPAIGPDGTVYVGSLDKKLYAIKTESKGLAKSPWPMRGQNARHAGRASKKPQSGVGPSSLKKGLVAYYPFNGDVKDASGKGRHGTIKSPARGYVTGKLGSGIAMTPSTSIALPLGHFGECTVSMWVKPDSRGEWNHLLSAHGFRRPENWIHLYMVEQGYPEAGVCAGAFDWTYSTISRQVQMPLKQWSHVAFSWGQPGLHLYLNGQLIGIGKRKRWSGPNPIYPKQLPGPPAAPVRLGKSIKEWRLGALFSADQPSKTAGMNGVMDEVRIHDRVLTEAEIKALYDLEKPSSETASGTKKLGTVLWEFKTGNNASPYPSIGLDGTVYVGSVDQKLYALDGATGAKKWEFKTGGYLKSSPGIGADGTVYFGSYDEKFYALDGATGAKKWEFLVGANVYSSPAIGSDGTVYVGSGDNKLYALSGKSGVKLWEFETGHWGLSSPAVGSDGTVYVGSDKKLYAFKTESLGLAKSPWPMFGQNAQRTGRASATPNSPKAAAAIEAAIRKAAGKPTGELTQADLEKVTELSLRGKQLTDLRPLTGLTRLSNLDLRANKLTNLKGLEGLKQLKELSLQDGNQLTDVSALAELTKLEWLALNENRLTDVSALAGLTQLKQLNLSINKITDEQLKHLMRLTNLTSIGLQGNPSLTMAAIAELQRALPNCKINHSATK